MTSTPREIDLNADLGEGLGDDAALLEVVTSANVACGGHVGDADSMLETCRLAVARGVRIGAHPSYDDREDFGRRALDVNAAALADSVASQLRALATAARQAGTTIAYVKPHGALYHRAASDPAVAEVIYRAAVAIDPALRLLAPPGSVLADHVARADHGVRCVVEGFSDRAYVIGLGGRAELAPRDAPGAVLGHEAAVAQARALATTGIAVALDGRPVSVHPRSICVHGDTPGAVELARAIRSELERAGVAIRAFAP